MAKLANSRHEAFARHLAKGRSQVEAYRLAGFDDPSNASRLATQKDLVDRVEQLKSAAARRAEVSTEFVLSGIKRLTKSADLKVSAKAYEMLAKHLGLFEHTKRVEHSGSVLQEHVDLTGLEQSDFQRMREIVEKARHGRRAD